MTYSRTEAHADRLTCEAVRQAEAAAHGVTLLQMMFLAWWAPLSILGLLPWWSHPPLWLGLAAFCAAAKAPGRATLRKAETLRAEPPGGSTQDPSLN